MARKVKETPTLIGRDAERFARVVKENESKKVERSDYERAKATYDRVRVLTTSSIA